MRYFKVEKVKDLLRAHGATSMTVRDGDQCAEAWSREVNGEVYQAGFAWFNNELILPEDQVRQGLAALFILPMIHELERDGGQWLG